MGIKTTKTTDEVGVPVNDIFKRGLHPVVITKPEKIKINKIQEKLKPLSCRDLDGKTWTKWSISVWDISKSSEERKLKHPAMFPTALCERLIRVYSHIGAVVLDPFMGSGSTLVAARNLLRKGIGFELYDHFVNLAVKRLREVPVEYYRQLSEHKEIFVKNNIDITPVIVKDDARHLSKYLEPETIDMCLTSPPYFNVHKRKRTSDKKKERPYGDSDLDLGNIDNYNQFLDELTKIFSQVHEALVPGGICAIVVMDIRIGSDFYPFHIDLHNKLVSELGFKPRDIIIWNRWREYNNIRPLGYPYKFIINKVHEYMLVYEK